MITACVNNVKRYGTGSLSQEASPGADLPSANRGQDTTSAKTRSAAVGGVSRRRPAEPRIAARIPHLRLSSRLTSPIPAAKKHDARRRYSAHFRQPGPARCKACDVLHPAPPLVLDFEAGNASRREFNWRGFCIRYRIVPYTRGKPCKTPDLPQQISGRRAGPDGNKPQRSVAFWAQSDVFRHHEQHDSPRAMHQKRHGLSTESQRLEHKRQIHSIGTLIALLITARELAVFPVSLDTTK